MAISDWPKQERPRERLLSVGSRNLSDAELLAVFLRTGRPGRSAVGLARDLLVRFGDLRELLDADHRRFVAEPGLGTASFAQLQAALEIVRRYQLIRLKRAARISSPRAAQEYLQLSLGNLPHEVFACLFLDNQHGLIAAEELFRGTIDGASVYPREIVKRCLDCNAAAVIFAHNHPSGLAEPSQADQRLTRRLQQALATVDIRVLDHLVIGDGSVVSFAETGLL
jgi:DNA repair protein RadC